MPISVCGRLGDSLPLWAQSSTTPRTCILIFQVIYGSEFNTILMFSATFSSPAVVEVQLPVCPDTQQCSDKSGLLPSYKLFCQQVTTIKCPCSYEDQKSLPIKCTNVGSTLGGRPPSMGWNECCCGSLKRIKDGEWWDSFLELIFFNPDLIDMYGISKQFISGHPSKLVPALNNKMLPLWPNRCFFLRIKKTI